MSYLIDRRLNGKDKSAVNRQRFLQRYRNHIRKAVAEAVGGRSITDMEKGESISIPSRDLNEPVFSHGSGGRRERVLPGNREFERGDLIDRPPSGGGGGSGSGNASADGEGEDDFVFQISQKEFLEFLFDDLELPNLVRRQLTADDAFDYRRAGIATDGNPSQINVVRTMRSALGRRLALSGSKRAKLRELEALLEDCDEEPRRHALLEEVASLKARLGKLPYLDDVDIRYNLRVKQPRPTSKAVMLCIMDVSGSMDQHTKDLAKRFFLLLYLFLNRHYKHTEVVFIRHHSIAKEVDEQEFFYSRETGGTVVSSALKLSHEIIQERYPISDWNIYVAQASDGDNWNNDSPLCETLLSEKLLPLLQYYCYVEITEHGPQQLWQHYENLAEQFPEIFAMRRLSGASEIYPVFHELFQRRQA